MSVLSRDRAVMLYFIGLRRPLNMGQVIYDHITQLNTVKEEPTKKFLFPCLIFEDLSSCLIAQYSSDIVVSDLGENNVTKKTKADIRKAREAEARVKRPSKPSNALLADDLLALADEAAGETSCPLPASFGYKMK
ncbi:hypothetical protein M9H77_02088 [Catharanthus roseus]|uniref:Uncharacterized protein n=1 Tax=Catharanthus roseus TaxID=4058 RepID=A0ACC0C7V0_CATRO|nr:hypothetical protein M9H77_02088 [Catharanthus roseus]